MNKNNIRLIWEKLNELRWNAFCKEKNADFRAKDINWKVFE